MLKQSALALASTIALGAGIAGSAEAAVFNFACPQVGCVNTASSFSFFEDGIGVEVTGFLNTDPIKPQGVNQAITGLGVLGQPLGTGNLGTGQVDAGARNIFETLRLTFDQKVKILSAEFRLVSDIFGEDSAKVILDGDELFSGAIPSTGGFLQGFPGAITFSPSGIGQVLDFTLVDKNDGYRLYSLEVEQVPEPVSALALLGVGAALVGGARKKQQSA